MDYIATVLESHDSAPIVIEVWISRMAKLFPA